MGTGTDDFLIWASDANRVARFGENAGDFVGRHHRRIEVDIDEARFGAGMNRNDAGDITHCILNLGNAVPTGEVRSDEGHVIDSCSSHVEHPFAYASGATTVGRTPLIDFET